MNKKNKRIKEGEKKLIELFFLIGSFGFGYKVSAYLMLKLGFNQTISIKNTLSFTEPLMFIPIIVGIVCAFLYLEL